MLSTEAKFSTKISNYLNAFNPLPIERQARLVELADHMSVNTSIVEHWASGLVVPHEVIRKTALLYIEEHQ